MTSLGCFVLLFIFLPEAPPPPSSVTIDLRSSTSISLSWDRINTGDVLGYRVTYTPVNWSCEGIPGGERIISEGDATSYHLDGLQEYINYSIVLQTKGRQGYGRQSAPVYERTLPAGMLEEMKLLSVCGIDL